MTRRARLGQALRDERGGSAVQTAILTPVILLLFLLVMAAGRVGQANAAIDTAAAQSSRAASIERTPGAARGAASAAARHAMASKGISCSPAVEVDTSGFGAEVGTPAVVGVTVRCTVPLGDLLVPGLPGSRTITAEATSPLDTYRERS